MIVNYRFYPVWPAGGDSALEVLPKSRVVTSQYRQLLQLPYRLFYSGEVIWGPLFPALVIAVVKAEETNADLSLSLFLTLPMTREEKNNGTSL